ncbi:type 4 prepilin peptidase 1 [Thermovibrio guaymasensis]|uniref:Prepilin leader peptidase/N-methyltransferase n=1 Tax=Thermovibrio guaymasensis TaxID=240167 RepID=A0A420W820_9BACT|nr:A24 family peptidase [Thermovibrio guaymasensis]RKQ63470.1 type 4 prepilin peptidase 1 [Thermovibrio guaymasensis]
MFLCLVAFLFGLIFGSFLNVCIYRIPKGKSILWPPSSCPNCGSRIKWYDNVPVLSYIILRGKCRNCGKKISPIYPIVELLTGTLTAAVVCNFDLSFDSLYYLILVYYLIVVSFIDMKTMEVPVKLSYFALVSGILLFLFTENHSFKEAIFGASLGAGVILFIIETYFVFTGKEGMGYGDANIMAVVGAFLGWEKVLLTLFLASMVGALYGLLTLKKKGAAIPFGPFISVGALISLFFGDRIINWYLGGLNI